MKTIEVIPNENQVDVFVDGKYTLSLSVNPSGRYTIVLD